MHDRLLGEPTRRRRLPAQRSQRANRRLPHDPTSIPDPSWADSHRNRVPIETAYFYSSIERADHNLGRLGSRLRELGLEDDTILIFMTDNGTAQGHRVFNAGMRGHKGSVYDGGHRVPCFVRWPAAGIAGGRDEPGLTAHVDLLPTLDDLCSLGVTRDRAPGWDGVSLIDPSDPEPVVLCAEHLFPDADDAPIRGVPGNDEPGPEPVRSAAFLWDEEVDDTLYSAQDGGVATPIDVRAIRVLAGGRETVLAVGEED
jgi:arylsulfatase A-like enzyme